MTVDLDRAEIRRYSGYKEKFKIIPEIENRIDELIVQLADRVRAKNIYSIHPVTVEDSAVSFGKIRLESSALAKNLDNCSEVVVLAATLGNEVDAMIRRYSTLDSTAMVLVQAIATEYLEKYVDQIEKDIIGSLKEGISLKPRFSPGYGDLSITCQKEVLTLLDAHRKIGLSCTSSHMLTPCKSVTAIIGITNQLGEKKPHKCSQCNFKNCEVRENEA
ncbi:MAG: methionine synthase [Filifactoraceae bacterium]